MRSEISSAKPRDVRGVRWADDGSAGYGKRVNQVSSSLAQSTAVSMSRLSVAMPAEPIVMRRVIGLRLRSLRQDQGRTLREVSGEARVSLGYLSEVERGQKEASSELLAAICGALEVPLSSLLRQVSDEIALAEGAAAPEPVVAAA